MIDSTAVIPVSEILAIGETLNYARRSIAVQWFIGNISTVIICLSIVALILASKIKPNSSIPIKVRSFSTLKTLLAAGIFIIGLIISQIMLKLSGVILWCIIYGTGMAFYLKWSSWFMRRNHKIPIGWIICLFAILAITTMSFNIIPSMVSANGNVQEIFSAVSR